MMPCSRMDWAKSVRDSSSKYFLGWLRPGSTWEIGSKTEPDSWLCRATSPINAPSPRPNPLAFAMGLTFLSAPPWGASIRFSYTWATAPPLRWYTSWANWR